jgi:hypothetical protein
MHWADALGGCERVISLISRCSFFQEGKEKGPTSLVRLWKDKLPVVIKKKLRFNLILNIK